MLTVIKYKRWLATLWLTGAFFLANAQTVWNKTYVEDRPVMLFGSVAVLDTAYIVTGSTNGKSIISSVGLDGNMINYSLVFDSNAYDYTSYSNALIKNSTGKLVFSGRLDDDSTSYLFMAISNESIDSIAVFQYYIPNTYACNGYKVVELDGYYYIAAIFIERPGYDADMALYKIDSVGNLKWQKRFNQYKRDEAVSLITVSNSHLIIGGCRNNLNNTNERANTWLLEVDTGGQIVRQWFDPNDSTYAAEGLLQTQDGGFIYGAQKKQEQDVGGVRKIAAIVKLDYNFSKQWVFEGGISSSNTGITDIEFINDTTYIACGNYTNGQAWIIKFTDNGIILWEKKYKGLQPSGTWNILKDIDVLPDGSFIAAGYCQWVVNPNNNPPQVGWLLKLDADGCEMESCLVSIDETPKSPKGDLNSQIQVYPNPAQNEVTIQYGNLPLGSVLQVFNVAGALIETQPITGPTGKLTLNTGAYPNGVYLARIATNAEIIHREKFVIGR